MGRVIADMCQERGVHQVVCGFDATANDTLGFPVYTNLEDVTEDVDVLIDFTAPGTLDTLSGFLRARKFLRSFAPPDTLRNRKKPCASWQPRCRSFAPEI